MTYHIISYKEIFETNNLIDASNEVKKRLKTDENVIVIEGNAIRGEAFVENVRRLCR